MTGHKQADVAPGNHASPLASALASVIESALQQYLKQDPDVLQKAAGLEGRVIAIEIRELGTRLYFFPTRDHVQVLGHYEGTPDTLLSGTLSGFARMALGPKEDALFGGAVEIRGDTETGQEFQDILAGVDLDWEEQLSRLTGDVVAHQAGKLVREGQRFIRQAAGTLEQDLSEYLQEEARLLPARIEVQHFLDEVDLLRSDTDRLDARVQRLLKNTLGKP